MSSLSSRIRAVQEAEEVQRRLEALPYAWVLVYDADTEEEAVYSMEVTEGSEDQHVVLAFEDRDEAEAYALSLSVADDFARDAAGYDGLASVQGLDVEALVVTSRDADFRVGVVFRGDLRTDAESGASVFFTGGELLGASEVPRVSLSITMVPDSCFEGKTTDDFLDPLEDPVWVLVHDEFTGDAQFFSMSLNGTASVVCFKDEEAARRCSEAMRQKGSPVGAARSLLLEELLERLGESEMEVCLVDEVVETVIDDLSEAEFNAMPNVVATDGADEVLGSFTPEESGSSVSPASVREMLEGLFDATDAAGSDGAPPSEDAAEEDGGEGA